MAKSGLGLVAVTFALAAAACQTAPDAAPYDANASMGMLIARDSCASCHAVSLTGDSPNARAPAFREIINRPGTTPGALAGWLGEAHNYPAEMGVHLEPHQVDSLVAYMLRMRSGDS